MEQLVALLCDELVERGHEVTLFATGDSETSAELRSLWDRGYEFDDEIWDWQFAEFSHACYAYSQAREFDVVHCHSYYYGVPCTPFAEIPNVHTHHVEMDPQVIAMYKRLGEVHVVVVSRYQARALNGYSRVELIPHGIETDSFPFGEEASDYLLFLGRMIEDKGPREAVEIARAAGMPLILAGPREEGFDERIAPLLKGEDVSYLGRVEPPERDRLLSRAAALLYPLRYPEPFGLVPIEAMACGTPVVGVGIGAVPELVEPGVTGYLASSWDQLAPLVPRALELDRAGVMAHARQRFDYHRMLDQHEVLYRRLASEARR